MRSLHRPPHRPLVSPCVRLWTTGLVLFGLASCTVTGERTRAVTVYGGRQVQNSLPEELILFQDIDTTDAYIAAVSYAKVIDRYPRMQWELEGNIAKNFIDQSNWEFNGALVLRWMKFPWNDLLRTSAAFGNGLSVANKIPVVEDAGEPDTGTNELLYFIVLEFEMARPNWDHWSLVLRVHHRSGVYGTFDDVSGGSNVLAGGVKYSW